jgi:hypothetical protein
LLAATGKGATLAEPGDHSADAQWRLIVDRGPSAPLEFSERSFLTPKLPERAPDVRPNRVSFLGSHHLTRNPQEKRPPQNRLARRR